jgi:hypothetical protein
MMMVKLRGWFAPAMCATIVHWPQPRSTEHACRADDVSDGLFDSTA